MIKDRLKCCRNLITSRGTITHIPTMLHQSLMARFQLVCEQCHIDLHMDRTERTKSNTLLRQFSGMQGNNNYNNSNSGGPYSIVWAQVG